LQIKPDGRSLPVGPKRSDQGSLPPTLLGEPRDVLQMNAREQDGPALSSGPARIEAGKTSPASLGAIGERLESLLQGEIPVEVLPKTSKVTLKDLRSRFPDGPIVVCDCYVDQAESGQEREWGYELPGQVFNIDHHAPTEKMTRQISAGVQAAQWVKERGVPPRDWAVVVNHTDADSVISSAIMRGWLPPREEFQQAVLAADHTCEPNALAHTLQALEPAQDLRLSLTTLAALLQGQPLPERALAYLEQSQKEKSLARDAFDRGQYLEQSGVAVLFPDSKVEGDMAVPLFPQAQVVVVAYPADSGSRWDIKVRLGPKARPGLTLNSLKLRQFDKHFGGRWNAGSTTRSGGTDKTPQDYLEYLSGQIGGSEDSPVEVSGWKIA